MSLTVNLLMNIFRLDIKYPRVLMASYSDEQHYSLIRPLWDLYEWISQFHYSKKGRMKCTLNINYSTSTVSLFVNMAITCGIHYETLRVARLSQIKKMYDSALSKQ